MENAEIFDKIDFINNITYKTKKEIKELNNAIECLIDIISFSLSNGDEINFSKWFFKKRFHQMLSELSRNQKPIALLNTNIDNFKIVNEKYGHSCGDKISNIKTLSLKKILRKEDTFARYGSGFLIITNSFSYKKEIEQLADRILNTIRESFDCDSINLSITTSIGVAYANKKPSTKDLIFRISENALNISKQNAKNNFTIMEV